MSFPENLSKEYQAMLSLKEAFERRFIPEPNSGCWLWIGALSPSKRRPTYGYIRRSRKQSNEYAHRLSWRLYMGTVPEGLCVLHQCDTPLCVNPEHLFLGTRTDNAADRTRKGRSAHGEQNGMSKLTSDQVREIRNAAGTHESIAKQFRVSRVAITQIRNNKRWREV